jgi:flagellar hook-length control protein FliK
MAVAESQPQASQTTPLSNNDDAETPPFAVAYRQALTVNCGPDSAALSESDPAPNESQASTELPNSDPNAIADVLAQSAAAAQAVVAAQSISSPQTAAPLPTADRSTRGAPAANANSIATTTETVQSVDAAASIPTVEAGELNAHTTPGSKSPAEPAFSVAPQLTNISAAASSQPVEAPVLPVSSGGRGEVAARDASSSVAEVNSVLEADTEIAPQPITTDSSNVRPGIAGSESTPLEESVAERLPSSSEKAIDSVTAPAVRTESARKSVTTHLAPGITPMTDQESGAGKTIPIMTQDPGTTRPTAAAESLTPAASTVLQEEATPIAEAFSRSGASSSVPMTVRIEASPNAPAAAHSDSVSVAPAVVNVDALSVQPDPSINMRAILEVTSNAKSTQGLQTISTAAGIIAAITPDNQQAPNRNVAMERSTTMSLGSELAGMSAASTADEAASRRDSAEQGADHRSSNRDAPSLTAPESRSNVPGAAPIESPLKAGPAEVVGRPQPQQRVQVVEQLTQKLDTMRLINGRQEATIHLRPEHLGDIRLTVVANGQDVSARIVAETVAARDAVQEGREQLRGSLEQRGYTLQGLDVSLGNNSHQRFMPFDQPEAASRFARTSGRTGQATAVPTAPPVERAASAARRGERLDYQA